MGGKSINTSPTRAEALTLQSSTYGATIAWLRGQHRLPGNLLWYGDFKATSHTQKQGGKGGGGKSTTYTYSASMLMGLCHGQVVDIPSVWKGKSRTTMAALGLTRIAGAIGQAVWSGLLGKGVEAIGYSGLAGVAVKAYELGDSPSLENHAFEVRHSSAYSVDPSTPDVDPAAATRELLLDPNQGAGLPAEVLGDWTAWSDYCIAAGLLMSPLLDTQAEASDVLERVADLTNTAIIWSDGKLQMRPYGDEPLASFGRVFTPDTTPVYELDDTCYLVNPGQAPVKRSLKTPADCFNQVSIEYKDRANAYNVAVATAKDLTDISANGVRPMDAIQAHWITDGGVARLVAEIKKQRSLLVVGEYTFTLPMNFVLLECMDLLLLTESTLLLEDVPVRVREIVEEGDNELRVTCEDYPAGVASAPRYPVQIPAGFADDAFAVPPSVADAVFFEAPAALAAGNDGLEIWGAIASPGANWGGCTVWVSLDGVTYQAMDRIEAGARMGRVAGPIAGGALAVGGMTGQLHSGSAADASTLTTLCLVQGLQHEFLAYETATLTGAAAYSLTGLVRGAYGTQANPHANGDRFIRIDEAIAKSGALEPNMVGRNVWFKLTSFNQYGGAEQSLAEVEPFQHVVSGAFAQLVPGIAGKGLTVQASALTFQVSKAGAVTPGIVTLKAQRKGTLQGAVAWTVVAGTSSLTAAGDNCTVAPDQMLTDTVTIRATVNDPIASYTADVTVVKVREGQDGAAGAQGPQGPAGQNGAPGAPGAPGAAGSNGANGANGSPAVSATLSNEAVTFPADSAGAVTSYAGNATVMSVFVGTADDSGNWTYSKADSPGVSSVRVGSQVVVENIEAGTASGYVDITAARAGFGSITKRFSITKSRAGVNGVNGANGTNGTNGTNGHDGAPGAPGAQGPQGNQGPQGAQGPAGANGANGANGQRGSIEASRAIGGAGWSDAEAYAAIADAGYGAPVVLDRVTLYNAAANFTQSRYFNGGGWLTWSALVNGNLLVNGSVGAAKMSVTELSAITAVIGLLRTASAGQRLEVSSASVSLFGANNGLRAQMAS